MSAYERHVRNFRHPASNTMSDLLELDNSRRAGDLRLWRLQDRTSVGRLPGGKASTAVMTPFNPATPSSHRPFASALKHLAADRGCGADPERQLQIIHKAARAGRSFGCSALQLLARETACLAELPGAFLISGPQRAAQAGQVVSVEQADRETD